MTKKLKDFMVQIILSSLKGNNYNNQESIKTLNLKNLFF
jgi:hypothetical protein